VESVTKQKYSSDTVIKNKTSWIWLLHTLYTKAFLRTLVHGRCCKLTSKFESGLIWP